MDSKVNKVIQKIINIKRKEGQVLIINKYKKKFKKKKDKSLWLIVHWKGKIINNLIVMKIIIMKRQMIQLLKNEIVLQVTLKVIVLI